jgi:hypothetical protein
MQSPETNQTMRQPEADAIEAPGEGAPRMSTHPSGMRGETPVDQRSLVIASLLRGPDGEPPAKR